MAATKLTSNGYFKSFIIQGDLRGPNFLEGQKGGGEVILYEPAWVHIEDILDLWRKGRGGVVSHLFD